MVVLKLTEGNTSSAMKAAGDAAKAGSSKGGKGKAKSKGGMGSEVGGGGGGGSTSKKAGRTGAPSESLAEVALSCLEECVCITAYSSPRARSGTSRTAKLLAVSTGHLRNGARACSLHDDWAFGIGGPRRLAPLTVFLQSTPSGRLALRGVILPRRSLRP